MNDTSSYSFLLLGATLALAACSSDDTATTAATDSDSATATASATDSTTSGTTATTTTSPSTTDMSGSGTVAETSSSGPGTTTTDPSTSGTDTMVDPTMTGSTTDNCLCVPGEINAECDGLNQQVCAQDCMTWEPTPCPDGYECSDGQCIESCICTPGEISPECNGLDQQVCADSCLEWVPQPCQQGWSCIDGECQQDKICNPGQTYCADSKSTQTCTDDGLDFNAPVPCAQTEECLADSCQPLCETIKNSPSSIGCSFLALRVDNFYTQYNDSVVVGNTYNDKTATVQLYFTPNNSNVEQPQGAAVMIPPGGTTTFTLTNTPIESVSQLRKGGTYRVQSNIPVIAYQHSPIGQVFTNDASMLLPEYALKQNYVVSSWRDVHGAYPSYFNVIAVEDGTKVDWTPPIATQAGTGVPAVAANATGSVMMNRYDTLQVRVANGQDISGTLIVADKPIWVVGATECTNVPSLSCLYCDHVQEQMLPLDYWGKEYVGAHSPDRGNEKHHWRVYAGEANMTVTTEPPQPGTPINFTKKGEYKDFSVGNGVSFVFKSDQPFLPVQYLESQTCGAGTGDPAMYQMIPVEQFLPSYAFATGTGNYPQNYVQIVRQAGGADVTVDGQVVNGYYTVGAYEVKDHPVTLGSHFAESADPFGIVGVGYSNATSYAYPGGLRLKVINPQ